MPAFLALLRTHARLSDQLESDVRRISGLSVARYDVLTHLDMAGGRLGLSDLAQAIVLSPSGLSKLIDRMQEAGLVERQPDPEDARSTYAAITRHGRAPLTRLPCAARTPPTNSRSSDHRLDGCRDKMKCAAWSIRNQYWLLISYMRTVVGNSGSNRKSNSQGEVPLRPVHRHAISIHVCVQTDPRRSRLSTGRCARMADECVRSCPTRRARVS
jgi:DNA-binding MarR family transcriptional regulator